MEVVATTKHFKSWSRRRKDGISKLLVFKVLRYDFLCLYKLLVLPKLCDTEIVCMLREGVIWEVTC